MTHNSLLGLGLILKLSGCVIFLSFSHQIRYLIGPNSQALLQLKVKGRKVRAANVPDRSLNRRIGKRLTLLPPFLLLIKGVSIGCIITYPK